MSPEEWSALAVCLLAIVAFSQLWVSHAQQNLCNVTAYSERAADRSMFTVRVQNNGPGIAYNVLVEPRSYEGFMPADGFEAPGIVSPTLEVHVDSPVEMEVLPPGVSTGTSAGFQGPNQIPSRIALHVKWEETRLFWRVTRQYTVPTDVPGEVDTSLPYPT